MATIKIPCHKAEPREVSGKVALIPIAGKPHRFFIHDGSLTDYRSGYRFGDLQSIKVERMARISHHTRTTDRQAAAILVARTVDKLGADQVLRAMAEKPTLNG